MKSEYVCMVILITVNGEFYFMKKDRLSSGGGLIVSPVPTQELLPVL